MDDSTEVSAVPPTDDGHLEKPLQGDKKRINIRPVPPHVVELLQAEIEIHNASTEQWQQALGRWNQKLASAAILSGVPQGSKFRFKQNADGAFVFITETQ